MTATVAPTTLVVAHRGASADAPDNSLEAFEKAIAVGSDLIEFDVRHTRDGELIAFHDGTVGGHPVGALFREEIHARTGIEPPLLTEVLDLTKGHVGLDIELKEDGYARSTLEGGRGRVPRLHLDGER